MESIKREGREKRLQKGFSLIEALIVFVIVGILCALALPQFTASVRANRVNTTNALLAGKLAEARIQAIKRNNTVSLVVSMQNRRMWLEAGGTLIGNTEAFPDEMQMQFLPSTSINQETIKFNSFGNLVGTPVTISTVNANGKLTKSLDVSLSGKITVGQMSRIP